MTDQNYPTASFIRRMAAMLYDGLILIALYIILGGLFATAITKIIGAEEMIVLSPAMALSLLFTFAFLYYSHFWRRGGQSIGMKAWRIKLINNNGTGPMQLSQFMLRVGVGFFSLVLGFLGFIWMLFDRQQRTWHDIASLTRVVHIPKDMQ